MHVDLGRGAWLVHEPGWLPPAEAARWLDELRSELAWEQREIVLFGRKVLQPRLIAWAGELPYRYSGQTLPPRPFSPSAAALLARVQAAARVGFNHLLANRYRDGDDSMGLHADDEPELGPDPVVATVSLGGARRFLLVPRRTGDARRSLILESGALLIMGGTCQRHFRHGIPRDPAATEERISLTFRQLKF